MNQTNLPQHTADALPRQTEIGEDTSGGNVSVENILQSISQRILSTLRQPFLILDAHLRVQFASHTFYDAFQTGPPQTLGKTVSALTDGSYLSSRSWASSDLLRMLEQVLSEHSPFQAFEATYNLPGLGQRTMLLSGFELDAQLESDHNAQLGDAASSLILLVFEDITEQKAQEIKARTQRREDRALRIGSRMQEKQLVADALRVSRVADGLQRALLQPIPETAFPSLSVAATHQGAKDASIGGDFFDAFLLPNDSIALVVGDVEGHGLEAAMRIGEIKYSLRAFLRENMNPTETLSRLNDLVHTSHLLDKQAEPVYTAVSLVQINPYTWEATFARAGAEPPLILAADGTWKLVEAKGTMLGIVEETVFETEKRLLKKSDTLLMYTDGLIEARVPLGYGFFGVERMAQQAHETLHVDRLLTEGSPVGSLLTGAGQAVLEAALAHAHGPLADDACLLLAGRR